MPPRTIVLYNPLTSRMARPHAPLPLLALARMADRRRHLPVIVNAAAEPRAHARVLEALSRNGALLGISAMTGYQIRDGLRLARRVRRRHPHVPIVWGGYHPSILPRETIEAPEVDAVVTGQGEGAFVDVLERIESGGALEGIAGVATPAQPLAPHRSPVPLERFDPLAWDLIDFSRLRRGAAGGPAVDYYTSQGCPFSCAFCAEASVHGRRRLALSPARAVEEIEWLSRQGVREIHLRDMLFFADPKWTDAFCDLVLRRVPGLAFHGANARVDGLLALSPEQWRRLVRAGFREVFVGVESGHAAALDRIGKRIETADTLEMVRRAAVAGVGLSLSVILGLPGVDPDAELRDTVGLLREAMRIAPGSIRSVFVFTYLPYPGSRLYGEALARGFAPPRTLEGWGRLDFHRTSMPWGSPRARRTAVRLHRYVLPRLLHTEPSRLRMVERLCERLDPRLERRWESGSFDRFWEQGVYDSLNALRAVARFAREAAGR